MADPGQPTLGRVYRGVKWGMYLLRIPLSCLETPIQAFPPPRHAPQCSQQCRGHPASATPHSVHGRRGEGSISPLRWGLTRSIPSWHQRILLGSEGEEALLGTIEPDAGLLEAVKVSQGKSLVS